MVPHLLGVLGCLTAIAAAAQVGPPVTPGFPNAPQVPGTVLSGLNAPQQGRTAILAYHNGVLFTVPEVPSSQPGADFQVRTWDISDPTAPVQLATWGITPMPVNAHGYLHSGDYLVLGPNWPPGGEWSFRTNGPLGVQRTAFPDLTCAGVRGCLFQPWFAGDTYWSYNEVGGDAELWLRNTRLAQWDHLGLTGVIGHPFIIGDLLIFASDQSRTGVATYDIRNPSSPQLLDVLTTGGPGGYWPEVWGGDGKLYVVFPYRENGNGMRVVDATDPANLRFVTDRPLPGAESMYIQFQDEFAFMGSHKVDMRTFDSVLFFDPNAERPNQPGVFGIDTSQFLLPLGNLLVTGGIGPNEGMAIWAHQADPDTRGPSVGYHIPQAGRTNYPTGAPISLLIHETLESFTIVNGETFIVRPLGGLPVSGRLTFAFDDILTFTPDQPLAANTTFEVIIPEGGIKDAAGNGIVGYSFNFSTGSVLSGNDPPVATGLSASPYPAAPNATVTLTAAASDPDNDPLEYRFDFGDGSPKTAWSSSASALIAYAAPGHYRASVQVRDPAGSIATRTITVTVLVAPAGARPTNSSPVLCDAAARRVWAVNPDNDSLAAIDADTLARLLEVPACGDPRGVARSAAGELWIACHDDDRVRVLDAGGTPLASLDTGYGSAPAAIAISPDGATAYVSLSGSGRLARFDTGLRQQSGSLALGPLPRAIAVSADGARVFVTRFLSPRDRAEVWEVNAAGLSLTRTIALPKFGGDLNRDSTAAGRGIANYLAGIVLSPDGRSAWIASNKPNTERGLLIGPDLDQDNTVRNVVTQIDLTTNAWLRTIDIDNSDSASAAAFSPLGDYLFVALQGNNELLALDALAIDAASGLGSFVARLGTGMAPQGVCTDAATGRTFVANLTSRSVSVLETGNLLRQGDISLASTQVGTVSAETFPADVLRGKQIFYDAGDPRMSGEGYLSCATCHLDGGHDGRVWDFTGRGEGLRNTVTLHGRGGTAHGNVHWSANFDEIQDLENDIRGAFGGSGFLADADFTAAGAPLGPPKAGRSAELDALAAYVSSLGRGSIPRSPERNPDGTMTAAALAGEAVFASLGCSGCHVEPELTDSTLGAATLHDVGTLRTTSGQRLGGPLAGIDTPTLLGVWETAPYFHDGSAATLDDVFVVAGGQVVPAESGSVAGAQSAIVSQWVELNSDDTVRGRAYAYLQGTGARLTLSGIDGGSGGIGALEFRYSIDFARNLVVTVNGVARTVFFPSVGNTPQWSHTNWGRVRVENVTLAAGPNNTVVVTAVAGDMWPSLSVDEVLVSTAGDLAAAAPHRVALALTSTERGNLVAFLRQLDGSSGPPSGPTRTPTATPSPTLTPTAAPSHTFTRTSTATPTRTATATATASATSTASYTRTATRTSTPIPTATATASPSHSPTSTPTRTSTATATATAPPTGTATRTTTGTATSSPSATATPPPSHTGTVTHTAAATSTSTHTASATPTSSSTASRTQTASPTRTPTATASFTRTATRTPSATFSRTSTRTATFTHTSTRTATPAFTGTSTATASSTPTSTVSLTPTRTQTPTRTPTRTRKHVRGRIHRSSGDAVGGVRVWLRGAAEHSAATATDGSFELAEVADGDWELQPEMADAAAGGDASVTPFDAALILQHASGTRVLAAYDLLGGDVTADGITDAFDAAQILRHAAGKTAALPAVQSCGSGWVFFPEPAPAENQTTIVPAMDAAGCRSGSIRYAPLADSVTGQDFVAVRLGDLTNSPP